MSQGAAIILGAGVTLGVTMASKVIGRLFRRKSKTMKTVKTVTESQEGSAVSTPKHSTRPVNEIDLKAFGSPTMIDMNRDRDVNSSSDQQKVRFAYVSPRGTLDMCDHRMTARR